jgi:ketosteroid isomerase-like protein
MVGGRTVTTASQVDASMAKWRVGARELGTWRNAKMKTKAATHPAGDPRTVAERWVRALTRHDLEAAVACFAPDYHDEAPARRGEVIRGSAKVRDNFAALFRDIPDLRADLLRSVADGDTVWMEWRMHGTRRDGTPFEFAGVNLFGIRDDRFAWGRIYTELVRDAGGIDTQVERMTKR